MSMLDSELAAERIESNVKNMIALYAPHIDQKKISNVWGDMRRRLDYAANRREFDNMPFRTAEQELEDVSNSAIRAFEALRSSGTLELFDKKATELHNSLARGV